MDIFRSLVGSISGSGDAFVGQQISLGDSVFTVKSRIAEGGFGIVYRCEDSGGRFFALKRMFAHDKRSLKSIRSEVNYLKQASKTRHPNILRFLRAAGSGNDPSSQSPVEMLLLTEFCPGGDMMAVLEQRTSPLSHKEVVYYFHQTCKAVACLHGLDPAVIHRDIKLQNFLLTRDNELKLCDFGSATTAIVDPTDMSSTEISLATENLESVTTPQNRTPEMLDMYSRHIIGPQGDIWALGCILYTLCYKVHPFEDGNKLAIVNLKYKLPEKSDYTVFHPLIQRLLSRDPADRPTADQLVAILEDMAQRMGTSLDSSSVQPPSRRSEPRRPPQQDGEGASHPTTTQKGGSSSFLSTVKGSAANLYNAAKDRVRSRTTRKTKQIPDAPKEIDVSDITPRLLVCGPFSEGLSLSKGNSAAEFRNYIGAKYGLTNCKLFNVGPSPFDTRLGVEVRHACQEQGSAPSLEQLAGVASGICMWLVQAPQTVAIVHCGTGQANSGTAAASAMCVGGLFPALAACQTFCHRRMIDDSMVIFPSQKRYVSYLGQIAGGHKPVVKKRVLRSVTLSALPRIDNEGCRPFVMVRCNGSDVASTRQEATPRAYGSPFSVSLNIEIEGDISVDFYHQSSVLGRDTSKCFARVQFHTSFVNGNELALEIDDADLFIDDEKFDLSTTVSISLSSSPDDGPPLPWLRHVPLAQCARARDAFFNDIGRELPPLLQDITSIGIEPGDAAVDKVGQIQQGMPASAAEPELLDLANGAQKQPSSTGSEATNADLLLDFGNSPDRGASSQPQSERNQPANAASVPDVNADLVDLLGGLSTTTTASSQHQPSQSGSADPFGSQTTSAIAASNGSNGWGAFGDAFDPFSMPSSTGPSSSNAPTTAITQDSSDPFGDFASFAAPSSGAKTTGETSNSDPFGDLLSGSHGSHSAELLTPTSGSTAPTQQSSSAGSASSTAGKTSFDAFADFDLRAGSQAQSQPFSAAAPQQQQQHNQQQQARNTAGPSAYMPRSSGAAKPAGTRSTPGSGSTGFDDLITDPRLQKKEQGPTTLKEMEATRRLQNEDPIKVKVELWAEGRETNLRALLSTLHNILPDPRWKPITLAQVMQKSKAKKMYQRACLVVHPDKNVGGGENEQLAREIFVVLSQAYTAIDEQADFS